MNKKAGESDDNVQIPDDRVTPRVQAENDMVALQRAQRNSDAMVEGYELDSSGEDAPSGQAEKPDDIPPADPVETIPPADKPQPEFDTLKVDGEETQVEKDKIYEAGRRALQMDMAADKRFEDAKQAAKEAKDLLTQAKQQAAELESQDQSDLLLADDDLDGIVNAIKYGDDSESKDAIKRLVQHQGAQNQANAKSDGVVTRNQVMEIVSQNQEARDFESALNKAKQPVDQGGYGFGDLFDGGILENAFAYEDKRLAESDPGMSYEDRFQRVGNTIREKFGAKPADQNGGAGSDNGSGNGRRKAKVSSSVSLSPVPMGQPEQTGRDERARYTKQFAQEEKLRRGL